MTRRAAPKKRKPTNTAGKDASPRGGMKTKQTKGANGEATSSQGSKTSSPGPKQTKITFAPTATADSNPPPTPKATFITIAITPEPGRNVAQLPLTTDTIDITSTDTSEKHKKTKKQKKIKKSRIQPPNEDHSEDDDDAKPAATQTYKAATLKNPPATRQFLGPREYKEIRYRGSIDVPPTEKPFQDFITLLTKYYNTVQSTLGKNIFLAPWDKEQETAFPPIKTPEDIPDSRETIGIYLGQYINPKEDGSRAYFNLRWITFMKPPVPLERFGIEVADALTRQKMFMNKQPQACQAVRSTCIGWFMYSTKQINSKTFIDETKASLGIPPEVAIGISYRAIMNEFGRRPQYDRDNPSPAAIHIDIDEKFYMVYQPRASSLWRKNSKKRLPNGVQLRLVPCFSSPIGKSMTDDIRADAKILAERQGFFVKEHVRPIDYYFISLLDTALSSENPMTLRRAMMARAPKDRPTSRLIHNVDQSWNQTSKYVVTTVIGREEEVHRYLSNLIPEMLHVHGDDAAKWFTSQGLQVYLNVRWNPTKGTTTSANAKESADMVKEDLWDLGAKWKTLAEETKIETKRPDEMELDTPTSKDKPATTKPVNTILERMAGDKSVASFGNAFGRDHDSDDERADASKAAQAAANPAPLTGAQFQFSAEQVSRERERADQSSESAGLSMSTAGKTTESTRLNLKIAQETIAELQLSLLKLTPVKTLPDIPKEPSKEHSEKTPNDASNEDPKERMETSEPTDDDEEPDEDKWFDPNPPDVLMDNEETEQPTDNALLHAAAAASSRESNRADSDAMEDDNHGAAYLSDLPPLPPSSESSASESSSESSSSSSSSSSSDGTHDTQELIDKLNSNPFLPLIQKQTSKKKVKLHVPSGSQDSASHQSPDQDSGAVLDHLHTITSGEAGVTPVDAGLGD